MGDGWFTFSLVAFSDKYLSHNMLFTNQCLCYPLKQPYVVSFTAPCH